MENNRPENKKAGDAANIPGPDLTSTLFQRHLKRILIN